ncbi:major facilitator superfamily domain-containing protein [Penicillium lagena]|uniref:major facilitator superfamily domain-containing protein n=1 Tax=Penicillium lagena TaxID=94218 RepID=UPI002542651C|nr:major facilitator superfamily domain-containing protein [Penicillium lagena]KAJ5610281.1 major facilitator superfamily domain-containing protein [Penicillium lagena]
MEAIQDKGMAEQVEYTEHQEKQHVVTDFKHEKSPREKRLLLKQDLAIVPLLAGCFFFAYLDRTQIGNAKVMGMDADLNMSSSQYYNCLMMFFVGYMVFELPAALTLRYIPAPVVFGSSVVIFGVIACCIAACHSYAPIMVLRLLTGAFEAVVQTGNLYLAQWYYPNEVGTRAEEEREMIFQRTKIARNVPDSRPKSVQILLAIKDPKSWLQAMAVAAVCLNVAAFGVFLPTFISLFGFSPLMTQLYTMIPYAFGIVTLPIGNILADRFDKKGIPILVCLSVCLIGYILLLTSTSQTVLVVGCCFVSAGAYPAVVLSSAWVLISHAGFTKRATSWAMAQIFIQCYSIISTQVYVDPPRFFEGHGTLLGLNALGVVAVLATMWIFDGENKRRDAVAAEFAARGEVNPDSLKDYEELCDQHPDFRYTL